MAEYINPQWRLPNKKTGNNNNYSMDFTMGTGVNFGSLSNILGNGIITYNTSYSVWIKPDFSYNTNTYQTFFGNFASGNNVLLLYYAHDINAFKFAVGDGSGHNFVSSQAFTSDQELGKGEWQHHCVSFDTVNNNAYYYIDNVQVNTSTGLSRKIATNQNFYIGKKWDLTSGGFTGEISQGCIFKYALPPTGSNSVAALWNGGNPGNPMALSSPPVAYYPLGNSAHMGSNYLTPNGALQDYVFNFYSPNIIDTGTSLTITRDLTLSGWVKFTSTSSGGSTVISKHITANAQPYYTYRLYIESNKAKFRIGISTATFITGSTDINDGEWHHVLGTYDGSNINLYVDGVSDATAVSVSGDLNTSVRKTTIGGVINGDTNTLIPTTVFNGELSNAQVFNAVLSEPEVETLYNYGSPIQTLANIPQNSNLKAWYKLDATEIYNSTSTEWSVDNNATPTAFKSSLSFDGAGDKITSVSNSGLTSSDARTFSAWIKTTDTGNNRTVVQTGPDSTNNNFELSTYGGFLHFSSWSTYNFTGNVAIADGDWHFICITFDGSVINGYVDGNSAGPNLTNASASLATTNTPYYIGGSATGNSAKYFNGEISNVQIFNTALSSTDVETLYNNGTPLTSMSGYSSLQGWWKLDNTTTGIQDSAGSNNGTNNGATEYAGFVNTLAGESSGMSQSNLVQSDLLTTSSYSPYAMSFDGGNDYIRINPINGDLVGGIVLPDNFTVSYWIKTNVNNNNSGPLNGQVNSDGIWSFFRYAFFSLGIQRLRINTVYTNVTTYLADDQWHNVIYTNSYDNTELKVYTDNVLTYENTTHNFGRGNNIANIGRGELGVYCQMQLSNLSIWNTALTSSQVSEIYSEGVPQNLLNHSAASSLINWWQLGSNSSFSTNWTLLDEKSSNNGTSKNMLENAIVDGVGTSGNGVSVNMGLANNISGSSPSGEANSLSVNMTLANIAGGVN